MVSDESLKIGSLEGLQGLKVALSMKKKLGYQPLYEKGFVTSPLLRDSLRSSLILPDMPIKHSLTQLCKSLVAQEVDKYSTAQPVSSKGVASYVVRTHDVVCHGVHSMMQFGRPKVSVHGNQRFSAGLDNPSH
jgi:hypothetical protein